MIKNVMKRTFISFSILSIFLISNCFATGVGYVDYGYIYDNYAPSKQYTTKINSKAQEIKKYVAETQKQVNTAKEIEAKNKAIQNRKVGLEKLKKEYSTLIAQQESLVKAKVKTASEIVRVQKGLDIIVNKKVWVAGGVDCSIDILKAIK